MTDLVDRPLVPAALARVHRADRMALAGLALFVPAVFGLSTVWHRFSVPGDVVLLGVVFGLGLAVTAALVAKVYRTTGVLALSTTGLGLLAVAIVGRFARHGIVSYWTLLALGMVLTAGLQVAVGARVQRMALPWQASAVTVALALAAAYVGRAMLSGAHRLGSYPEPPGFPTYRVGRLLLSQSYMAMLVLSPVLLLLAAVPIRRMRLRAAWAWALLGSGTSLLAVLSYPTQGFASAGGGSFFVGSIALMCAGLAGLRPVGAAAAGIAAGILQQVLLWNWPTDYFAIGFGSLVLVVLAAQSRRAGYRLGSASEGWQPLGRWEMLVVLVPAAVALVVGSRLSIAHTYLLCGGVALILFAVPHVLVRHRGLNLAFPVSGYLGAVTAWSTASAVSDVVVLTLVAVVVGVAVTGLLALVSTGDHWRGTIGSLALGAAITAWFARDYNYLNRPRFTLFGHAFTNPHTEFRFCLALLVVACILLLLARRRSSWTRVVLSGAIVGMAGFAFAVPLSSLSVANASPQIALTTAAVAATVVAVSGSAVAVATAVLVVAPLFWWDQETAIWRPVGVQVVIVVLALFVPRLLPSTRGDDAPDEPSDDDPQPEQPQDALPPNFDDVLSN